MVTDTKQYTDLINSTLVISNDVLMTQYYKDLVEVTSASSGKLLFHKDILLVLMEFVTPKPVLEFLEFFSTAEDLQLISTIEFLKNKMILQSVMPSSESIAPAGNYKISREESLFFNLHNHHIMLMDFVRTGSYRRAIENNVKEGDVVLELGCGTGILSFFAAQAGAKKLFSIEANRNLVESVASPLAQANHLEAQIEFIVGNSKHVSPDWIDPKPDVFIAEILGDGVLNENIIQYTIDARDRFLKEDTRMIPFQVDLHLFFFDLDEDYEQEHQKIWKITKAKSSDLESYYVRYTKMKAKRVSSVEVIQTLDLRSIKTSNFIGETALTIQDAGTMNWGCLYFTAHLDESTKLSNAPWNPQTSWTQQIFKLKQSRSVQVNETVNCKITYTNGRLQVETW